MSEVFLSYSHSDEDVEFVQRLVENLKMEGVKVWMDTQQIKLGESWQDSIYRALDKAEAIVVVVSPDSSRSKWIEAELEFSKQRGKSIIPVLISGDENTVNTLNLNDFQYIDARQNYNDALQQLARTLRQTHPMP